MVEGAVENNETEETTRVVVLRAGQSLVAVDALDVVEIVLRGPVTRVPYSPPHFLGLCVVAGRLLPVFCLREILQSKPGPPATTLPRLVVLKGEEDDIAFSCEEAQGVVAIQLVEKVSQGPFARGYGQVDENEVPLLDTVALVRAAMAHTNEGER